MVQETGGSGTKTTTLLWNIAALQACECALSSLYGLFELLAWLSSMTTLFPPSAKLTCRTIEHFLRRLLTHQPRSPSQTFRLLPLHCLGFQYPAETETQENISERTWEVGIALSLVVRGTDPTSISHIELRGRLILPTSVSPWLIHSNGSPGS